MFNERCEWVMRIVCVLIVVFMAACNSDVGTEGVLQAMEATNRSSANVSAKYADLSKRATAFGDSPRTLSDAQLREAFKAVSMTTFYASLSGDRAADAWLVRLQATFRELQRRDLADDAHTVELFDQLITLRRFDAAAVLKRSSSFLSNRSIPVVHFASGFDANRPAAMTLRRDGGWDVANVHLPAQSVVAVVGCANSADAVTELTRDVGLMRSLDAANVLWLTDASALAMEGLVAWWNTELPNQRVQVAWRNDAWTGIDFSAMPSFHYLRNGRVIRRQAGDEPSTPREIRAGLEALSASP